MNPYDNIEKSLTQALRAANVKPYDTRGMVSAKHCAQAELSGRSHYVDDSTLRYFHCRIVAARPMFDGAFYRVVESSAMDYQNTKRGFAVVLFDAFGTVVHRANLEDRKRTREAAEKAFSQWLASFDPIAHYREVFTSRADRLQRESEESRKVAASLTVAQ